MKYKNVMPFMGVALCTLAGSIFYLLSGQSLLAFASFMLFAACVYAGMTDARLSSTETPLEGVQTTEGVDIMELISGVVAIVTGLMTAAVALLVYAFDVPQLGALSFVAYGYIGMLPWVVSTFVSGYETRHPTLYHLTHLVSWVAWACINVALAVVLYRTLAYQPDVNLNKVLEVVGATQLLIALAAFSWFDVLYIQRKKNRDLKDRIAGHATVPRHSDTRTTVQEPAVTYEVPPAAPDAVPETRWVDVGFRVRIAFSVQLPNGRIIEAPNERVIEMRPAR